MNLYELTGEYYALQQMLEEGTAEESEIMEALEAVADSIERKADAYARIIKNMTAEADALEAEAKRLNARRVALNNGIDRLKANLQNAMTATGQKKVKTSIGSWYIQRNPMSANVTDVSKVPARFLIEQPPKVDRQAMLREFKDTGELFDGVEFVSGESVRFR